MSIFNYPRAMPLTFTSNHPLLKKENRYPLNLKKIHFRFILQVVIKFMFISTVLLWRLAFWQLLLKEEVKYCESNYQNRGVAWKCISMDL